MLTPGAATSGCRKHIFFRNKKQQYHCWENFYNTFKTVGERELGPRAEKKATSGETC